MRNVLESRGNYGIKTLSMLWKSSRTDTNSSHLLALIGQRGKTKGAKFLNIAQRRYHSYRQEEHLQQGKSLLHSMRMQ